MKSLAMRLKPLRTTSRVSRARRVPSDATAAHRVSRLARMVDADDAPKGVFSRLGFVRLIRDARTPRASRLE